MSLQATKQPDTEQERQQRMAELASENGPNWLEQYRPGSFGCHELLDRTSVVGDIVEEQVFSHPACAQNAEWYALAEQAVTALRELYQRIGEKHMIEEKSPK
jgi:hypothetical protein